MTSTTKEFREFLLKQNALALAIGVIIGAAIGKVVSGIVEDVLMPVIGLVLPGGEWRAAQLTLSGQNAIKYGDLAGRVIDFFVIRAGGLPARQGVPGKARPGACDEELPAMPGNDPGVRAKVPRLRLACGLR